MPARRVRPRLETLEDRAVPVTNVTDLTGNLNAQDLAGHLAGNNITVENVTYTGAAVAAGTFSGGTRTVGISAGVVLSTGQVTSAIGFGPAFPASTINNTPGDPALNKEAHANTVDMARLDLDIVPQFSTLALTYVLASELYPNPPAPPAANDVLAIYVDGARVNLIPGTRTIVGTATVNTTAHKSLFINNAVVQRATSFNGFTVPITDVISVAPNVLHHVRIEVVDGNVGATDTAVFLANKGLVSYATPIVGPVRYAYNATAHAIDGTLTITNLQAINIPGPIFITIKVPAGMTLLTPHGTMPSGRPYFVAATSFAENGTLRLPIRLATNGARPVGTAFINAFDPKLQNIVF